MGRIDLKDATIKLVDGDTTPNSLTIKIGDGNITWTEHKPRIFDLDRGTLDGVRDDDEQPMDVSLDITWEEYTAVSASGTPSPIDFIKKVGEASAYESTNPDDCQPYAIDIEIVVAPNCPSYNDQKFVFPMFYYEQVDGDVREATLSTSGRCNATEPTATRLAS